MEYLHHSSMIALNFHTDFISIIVLMLDVSFNGRFFVFVDVGFLFFACFSCICSSYVSVSQHESCNRKSLNACHVNHMLKLCLSPLHLSLFLW